MKGRAIPLAKATTKALVLMLVTLLGACSITGLDNAASATAATRVFAAAEDTYASYVETREAHGDWPRAWAMLGNQNAAFLKFNLQELGDVEVTGATLRLHIEENRAPGGLQVFAASDDWSEAKLTMVNRPAHIDRLVSQPVNAAAGQWVDIPVSVDVLDRQNPTSFEIRNSVSGSAMRFSTKEGGKAPELVLTTSAASPAVAAPTPGVSVSGGPALSMRRAANAKMVFAHYFTPYPISIDNRPAAEDYYAVHYLNPQGENGKFAAVGGLLRDRPLPRDPIASQYQLRDLETEVRQAKAAGIDGFTLDILDYRGTNWSRAMTLLKAAENVGGFQIVPMPDMKALGGISSADMAELLASFDTTPATYHLNDGRMMVSPFYAEGRSPAWWSEVIAGLRTRGIDVALVPTFIDWPSDAAGYARISHGLSMWGGRSPANMHADYAPRTRALGVKWMQPVAVQDERPAGHVFDEAENTAALRRSWQLALDSDAEWVQMTTWNDYSEGTSFAPSVHHGHAFLDLSSYYISQFKGAGAATILRDAAVVTHRMHPVSARPAVGSQLMSLRSNSAPARDTVEAVLFLTAPASATLTLGGQTHTWSAPAGMSVKTVPLATGRVEVKVLREGDVVTRAASPFEVTNSPRVQDLQYVAASSLR